MAVGSSTCFCHPVSNASTGWETTSLLVGATLMYAKTNKSELLARLLSPIFIIVSITQLLGCSSYIRHVESDFGSYATKNVHMVTYWNEENNIIILQESIKTETAKQLHKIMSIKGYNFVNELNISNSSMVPFDAVLLVELSPSSIKSVDEANLGDLDGLLIQVSLIDLASAKTVYAYKSPFKLRNRKAVESKYFYEGGGKYTVTTSYYYTETAPSFTERLLTEVFYELPSAGNAGQKASTIDQYIQSLIVGLRLHMGGEFLRAGAAVAALKQVGEPAVEPLCKALRKDDALEVRFYARNIVTVLGEIGDSRAIPVLEDVVNESKKKAWLTVPRMQMVEESKKALNKIGNKNHK